MNSLWSELSATKTVRAPDIYRVVESDFVPQFNPFSFYLEHLPPWDGQDYLMELSVSVSVKAPIKREKSDACIGSSEREVARSEIRGEVEEQLLFAEYLKKWLVGCNITQKLSSVALGRAFVNQGFAKKTVRNVRGYVVVRRSAEEMQASRRLMAHEADTDTDDTDVF